MKKLTSSRRGVTLIETMIAMTIAAFIFAFTGFLIMMAARNAYNINVQIRSQTTTSTVAERMTGMLRGASCFALWPDDATATTATVSRVRFIVPAPNNTVTTQVICFNPVKERVEYYVNEDDVRFSGTKNGIPIPHGKPTTSYPGIKRALINWESEYRLTLACAFEYSGFALKAHGKEKNIQLGQFITDVIARNHFMDEGVQNYAVADVATSSPATL